MVGKRHPKISKTRDGISAKNVLQFLLIFAHNLIEFNLVSRCTYYLPALHGVCCLFLYGPIKLATFSFYWYRKFAFSRYPIFYIDWSQPTSGIFMFADIRCLYRLNANRYRYPIFGKTADISANPIYWFTDMPSLYKTKQKQRDYNYVSMLEKGLFWLTCTQISEYCETTAKDLEVLEGWRF